MKKAVLYFLALAYLVSLRPMRGASYEESYLHPDAPILTQVRMGTLPTRTEHYVTTFVSPHGESLASPEENISAASGYVIVVSPPDYRGPHTVGYNVYGGVTSDKTLQNAKPIPLGKFWTEPPSGLIGSHYPLLAIGNAPTPACDGTNCKDAGGFWDWLCAYFQRPIST